MLAHGSDAIPRSPAQTLIDARRAAVAALLACIDGDLAAAGMYWSVMWTAAGVIALLCIDDMHNGPISTRARQNGL